MRRAVRQYPSFGLHVFIATTSGYERQHADRCHSTRRDRSVLNLIVAHAPISPLQNARDRVGKDLRAKHDIVISSILGPIMTDAIAAALKPITFPTMRRSRIDQHIGSRKTASPGLAVRCSWSAFNRHWGSIRGRRQQGVAKKNIAALIRALRPAPVQLKKSSIMNSATGSNLQL